jgi:hypothetical protein
VLQHGFALVYDMVFTPRQDLTAASIGLGPNLPRAVPADAVVALATLAVPGELLQKAVLVLVLAGAAAGAARLTPHPSRWARAAAGVLYGWNPYVAERLFVGHWALLVGYAALPWVAGAALGVRRGDRGAWPRLLLAATPAMITPTGGLIAAATAIAVAGQRGRRALGLLGALVVLNGPWLAPALLHPGGGRSDPAGVAAFAARAENWSGAVGSLLGLGGIWNAEVVPGSRTSVVAPLCTGLLLVVAALGVRCLLAGWGRAAVGGLAAVAAGGLAIALLGALPVTADLLRWVVAEVPGGGLLRDGQKWIAPFALLLAVSFGAGAGVLASQPALRERAARGALAVGGVLLPLVMLPDLAWGGFGRLEAARYPADWAAVRTIVATTDQPGDLVSLPFATYRAFPWNDGRTLLDPAPRWFPVPVVADDALPVGGVIVAGEDRRVAGVRAALERGRPLGEVGIGWVLVEKGTPGQVPEAAVRGLERVYDGTALSLYRVPAPRPAEASGPPVVPVVAADAAAVGMVLGAGVTWAALRTPRRRGSDPAPRGQRRGASARPQ